MSDGYHDELLEKALEYLDRGWSIIPIDSGTKRPKIKWRDYQKRLPTESEVRQWWTDWPGASIAIVTGELSGVVVVDCDNDNALEVVKSANMTSPIAAKTKRGRHYYFAHPRDGVRRGPRAGVNTRGADWPRVDGLDFRGDGSYALIPPTKNYSWEVAPGFDHEDAEDFPVWKDWKPSLGGSAEEEFSFADLDLSDVSPNQGRVSEWDKTKKFVQERFPDTQKIPSGQGNGRNERLMRHISDSVMEGNFGAELRLRGYAFMREFFAEALPEAEFEATVSSIEESERRNHPERFNATGDYIYSPSMVEGAAAADSAPARERKLIQMCDAEALLDKAGDREYLIEPWLTRGTIVQVYGYSGHGKSLFVQHAMASLCAGEKYFGPFEVGTPARVLYLDYEMGMSTIANRLIEMRAMHGDTQDRLNIWAPFIDSKDMRLNTPAGLAELQQWIEFARPDVVVIDTIRSSYPGMDENSASEWSNINQLAIQIRNAGMSVIMLHHSNKPSESGVGREAGSTNQLTVLETQIRITQVYKDQDTAKHNAAIFDEDYDRPVWPLLSARLPDGYKLYMVMEVRYGKVREWTDTHDRVQWIGFATHHKTGESCVVSSRSTKQRAKDLAIDGIPPDGIADALTRPIRLIREWLGIKEADE